MAKKKTLPEEELNEATVPVVDTAGEQNGKTMEAAANTALEASPAESEAVEDAQPGANEAEPVPGPVMSEKVELPADVIAQQAAAFESWGEDEEDDSAAGKQAFPEPRQIPVLPPELDEEELRPSKTDRQKFFDLDFRELDRWLSPEERREWNSIYASYRGRSALTGRIMGVDPRVTNFYDKKQKRYRQVEMLCATVVLYRIPILIPMNEMWEQRDARPDFVFKNMDGAEIDFIITKVDREKEYAVASRRLAMRAQRYFFARRPELNETGSRLECRVLAVGHRRCLVECYGHDIDMRQKDLRYLAIPNLKEEYHPGDELPCIVKNYDAATDELVISVKEVESNPFEGAEFRHPVGCRRYGVIAGKYGGGVFCNLPDGTVIMCNYSYQHSDEDFRVNDNVILVIHRYENEKKQIYGKIMSKW